MESITSTPPHAACLHMCITLACVFHSFHPVSLKAGECEALTSKERARARVQTEACWEAAKEDGTFGRGYERTQKQFS